MSPHTIEFEELKSVSMLEELDSTRFMRRINSNKFDEVYHVSDNDATLLFLIGHAFFWTFFSSKAVHRMSFVAILLLLLHFYPEFIIAYRFDSLKFMCMMTNFMSIISLIFLGDMIPLSIMVDAPPSSGSKNEEWMSFILKKIVITIAFTTGFTGLLAFTIRSSAVPVCFMIFCIYLYTVAAVPFCYQLFILFRTVGINENNTEKMRRFCCCALTNKSKQKYSKRSKSRCRVCHKPRSQDDVESLLYPNKLTIAVMYLVYIAYSIFEALYVDQDHDIHDHFSEPRYRFLKPTIEPLVSNQQYHTFFSTKSDTFSQKMIAR